MKIKKIQCKENNLKVKGQGCWDDCYHEPYYKGKTSYKDSPPCTYVRGYYDQVYSMFW